MLTEGIARQGYGGCVYVTGEYPLPIPNKHFVHWTVDSANGGGVSFAVEVRSLTRPRTQPSPVHHLFVCLLAG